MRTLLISAGLFFFLHSSYGPSWGGTFANAVLLLVAFGFFGGLSSKAKIPYRKNRLYDNDYYDQQHH
jgi:hypothetical protein